MRFSRLLSKESDSASFSRPRSDGRTANDAITLTLGPHECCNPTLHLPSSDTSGEVESLLECSECFLLDDDDPADPPPAMPPMPAAATAEAALSSSSPIMSGERNGREPRRLPGPEPYGVGGGGCAIPPSDFSDKKVHHPPADFVGGVAAPSSYVFCCLCNPTALPAPTHPAWIPMLPLLDGDSGGPPEWVDVLSERHGVGEPGFKLETKLISI